MGAAELGRYLKNLRQAPESDSTGSREGDGSVERLLEPIGGWENQESISDGAPQAEQALREFLHDADEERRLSCP